MTVHVQRRDLLRKGRVFDITVENVTFASGFNLDLEIIRHPGAAAIVPLNEANEVLLLKQYRHAIGGDLWEIPAGTFEDGEAPLVCAQRELGEETGHMAATWTRLGAITPVPGYSDERIQLFLARDLTPTRQKLDPDEIVEVHKVPLNQVIAMIAGGRIEDAKTIAGIFLTLNRLKGAMGNDRSTDDSSAPRH